MTCLEIISKLLVYQLQLINVLDLNKDQELAIEMSNEYSYITIDIMRSGEQFAQIRFELSDDAGIPSTVYWQDKTTSESGRIKQETWPGWSSPSRGDLPYSGEVIQSLQTADSIAALTTNCTRGDDYYPGNFSKIAVNNQRIELRQINHMNAKSLAHKHDYSLRTLVFTIPFEPEQAEKELFQAYRAGNMIIKFSDNSSENNKPCGQKVIKAIKALE